MAVLQALISFLGRSARRVFNAMFGWAVVALFGRSTPRQHFVLTMVVALAALWPLLLAGIAFPKVAVFVLAFVPVLGEEATLPLRLFWIVLTAAVPVTLGLVMAVKAPPGSPAEPFVTKALRGVPVTLGIVAAFLMMFLIVPVLRIASLLRGWKEEHVPLITHGDEYQQAAARIDRLLEDHALSAARARPPWWLAVPAKVLQKLGGKALRGYMPDRLAYWQSPGLELALYPSDLLVRGRKKRTASVRGLIDETFARGPGFMTHDPASQAVEKAIQQIWEIHAENPRAHADSRPLLSALGDVAGDISRLEVEYEQWQVVYRKALQLGRALRGERQLLRATLERAEAVEAIEDEPEDEYQDEHEDNMPADHRHPGARPLADVPTRQLVKQAMRRISDISEKQIELARTELRADVQGGIATAKGMGVAAVCAITGVNLLLVALVFALGNAMPAWAAALILATVVLVAGAICGVVSWKKRVKTPLQKTRSTLKEGYRWAKQRMA